MRNTVVAKIRIRGKVGRDVLEGFNRIIVTRNNKEITAPNIVCSSFLGMRHIEGMAVRFYTKVKGPLAPFHNLDVNQNVTLAHTASCRLCLPLFFLS